MQFLALNWFAWMAGTVAAYWLIPPRVRDFIAQNYYVPDPSSLSGDTSLVDDGILDSTGVLELAAFIEDLSREERTDPGLLREAIRVEVRRFFRKRTGRRPLVLPIVMEI